MKNFFFFKPKIESFAISIFLVFNGKNKRTLNEIEDNSGQLTSSWAAVYLKLNPSNYFSNLCC